MGYREKGSESETKGLMEERCIRTGQGIEGGGWWEGEEIKGVVEEEEYVGIGLGTERRVRR